MNDKLTEQQTSELLRALDDAIANGPWEESNFLRVIGKNLREIRENFVNLIGDDNQHRLKTASNLANRVALRSGQQEVFIALYASEGNSIQAWERIVANLPRQVISRPVYVDEEDVKYLIKSKENKINEAYVGIYINQNDILALSADKTPTDKFGKPLLSLKDKAINLENITRFVHMSGIYTYSKGRLIKNHLAESS
ncbi:Dot/Icm secretion system protein IcmQ [Legionella spiritensis]|uniref:IcmQ n=1 Tax=Legionella spiritensis TaxID=452 RepID=Q49J51_LEGSP|nr:Dot/Icm secretion system protein IcmQ [Legionella spiritensis]AAX56225.1 IcmQ [Legionella spiritensis]KTD65576.1 IcmQ protein [Legionella spiritensis]SNV44380.1 IcmQ protein [Legionella spiritensis]